jgi:hypothetical protein
MHQKAAQVLKLKLALPPGAAGALTPAVAAKALALAQAARHSA